MNVFAEPGEVFEEIKSTPPATGNWLVPVFLWALVGIVTSVILLSQPAIQHQIHEQQAKAMDKMVQQGKLTREQADQATAAAEKFTGPTMLMLFGGVGSVVVSIIHAVWWALVLWLLGRWLLKSQFPYTKALEVAGLPMMIGALGAIVGLLLGIILSRMYATPSAALLITDFDVTNKAHLFVATLNPFQIWQAIVMGVGLAKVTGAAAPRAVLGVLVFWAVQESLLILAGMGQMAL